MYIWKSWCVRYSTWYTNNRYIDNLVVHLYRALISVIGNWPAWRCGLNTRLTKLIIFIGRFWWRSFTIRANLIDINWRTSSIIAFDNLLNYDTVCVHMQNCWYQVWLVQFMLCCCINAQALYIAYECHWVETSYFDIGDSIYYAHSFKHWRESKKDSEYAPIDLIILVKIDV